jgi:hypothetical protein
MDYRITIALAAGSFLLFSESYGKNLFSFSAAFAFLFLSFILSSVVLSKFLLKAEAKQSASAAFKSLSALLLSISLSLIIVGFIPTGILLFAPLPLVLILSILFTALTLSSYVYLHEIKSNAPSANPLVLAVFFAASLIVSIYASGGLTNAVFKGLG